jgi:hypothetical protein
MDSFTRSQAKVMKAGFIYVLPVGLSEGKHRSEGVQYTRKESKQSIWAIDCVQCQKKDMLCYMGYFVIYH